jgi:hypothetical protein
MALCIMLATLSTQGFSQTPSPDSVNVTHINERDVCHFQGYTITADQVVCVGITITATGKAKVLGPQGNVISANTIIIPDCLSSRPTFHTSGHTSVSLDK